MRYRMARLGVHVAGDGVTLDDGEPGEAGDSGGSE
jgi:hypothetical protein